MARNEGIVIPAKRARSAWSWTVALLLPRTTWSDGAGLLTVPPPVISKFIAAAVETPPRFKPTPFVLLNVSVLML